MKIDIKAWLVREDGTGADEGQTTVVYAATEDEARAHAWANVYVRNWGKVETSELLSLRRVEALDKHAGAAAFPFIEERDAVYREVGCTWEGEPTCIHCGLSGTGTPTDPPEWKVCVFYDETGNETGCESCGECGHAEGCSFDEIERAKK